MNANKKARAARAMPGSKTTKSVNNKSALKVSGALSASVVVEHRANMSEDRCSMSPLDQISDNLRRSLQRPLCLKCQLSNVETLGDMCAWCKTSHRDRKAAAASLKQHDQHEGRGSDGRHEGTE